MSPTSPIDAFFAPIPETSTTASTLVIPEGFFTFLTDVEAGTTAGTTDLKEAKEVPDVQKDVKDDPLAWAASALAVPVIPWVAPTPAATAPAAPIENSSTADLVPATSQPVVKPAVESLTGVPQKVPRITTPNAPAVATQPAPEATTESKVDDAFGRLPAEGRDIPKQPMVVSPQPRTTSPVNSTPEVPNTLLASLQQPAAVPKPVEAETLPQVPPLSRAEFSDGGANAEPVALSASEEVRPTDRPAKGPSRSGDRRTVSTLKTDPPTRFPQPVRSMTKVAAQVSEMSPKEINLKRKENDSFKGPAPQTNAKQVAQESVVPAAMPALTEKVTKPAAPVMAEEGRIDPRHVVDQITTHVELQHLRRNGHIQISLEPKELGKVSLELKMDNGTLAIQAKVETTEVKQALESQVDQLRQALQPHHIVMDRLEVRLGSESLQTPSSSFTAQQESQQSRYGSAPKPATKSVPIETVPRESDRPSAAVRGRIDYWA